jgi:glycosyltransferase involved in cell wall biosynthesis
MKNPTTTIGVISYNNAKFLPETIDSILAQTVQDFEIIIADDGSQDNSMSIAESYASKNENIRIVTHENHVNKGVSATCNLAVKQARGKFIALIGSDDAYFPHYIEKTVTFLQKHPKIGFVYGEIQRINEKNEILPNTPLCDVSIADDPIQVVLDINGISAATVMVKRECYEKVGLYEERIVYSDWEMWLKILNFYQIGFIPDLLAKYRLHQKNLSMGIDPSIHHQHIREFYTALQEKTKVCNNVLSEEKYQKFITERLACLPEKEAMAHLNIYFSAIAEKRFSVASIALKKALNASPRTIFNPRRIAAISKQAVFSFASLLTSKTT